MRSSAKTFGWFLLGTLLGNSGSLPADLPPAAAAPAAADAGAAELERAPPALPQARYLVVPLPLTGNVDLNIRSALDQLVADLPRSGTRPILVLEFRPRQGQAGEGSEFERALALARYLAGDRVRGLQVVAYLPQSIKGHAVLPVLACEEIIMHPDATLGAAGVDETFIDPTVRRGYSEIAERRLTVATAVALGMLDKELTVYRVQTGEGSRYVLGDELEALKQQVAVSSVETVVGQGEWANLTGREMRLKYGFATYLVEDRGQLAAALKIPQAALEEDPSQGAGWRPVRVDLDSPIHQKNINWIERSLRQRLANEGANLILVAVNSPGGSLLHSVRFANYLSSLPHHEVRTVAYVQQHARGDAALIAWSCDHLVMAEGALLGGPGAASLSFSELEELKPTLIALADARQRSWSLPLALLDPTVSLFRYERVDRPETRYLCEEEFEQLDEQDKWVRKEEVDVRQGITGRQAADMQLARWLARDFDELARLYHIDGALPSVRPNWAHVFIEYLASPQLAGALLFIGCFALMVEFSTPGVGVAGMLSGLCFLLFFWANFLHGTAGWLEVLLFVAGLSCIALEIFVIPGVGVFGIGGALMVVVSLVLASQTFIIPRNAYQLSQIPGSLFMVVAAGGGTLIAMAVLRRFLAEAPVFRRMMLSPPDEDKLEELDRRESLVDWAHLMGKCGVATTQLLPGGKARFGDELVTVMSDGELIEPGTRVCVVDVRGNRVLVQALGASGK